MDGENLLELNEQLEILKKSNSYLFLEEQTATLTDKKIEVRNELEQDNSLEDDEVNEDLEVKYEELKVTEIKNLAKEKGIEGFEDMKKAEVIQVLAK